MWKSVYSWIVLQTTSCILFLIFAAAINQASRQPEIWRNQTTIQQAHDQFSTVYGPGGATDYNRTSTPTLSDLESLSQCGSFDIKQDSTHSVYGHPFRINTDFDYRVTLHNSGKCTWLAGIYLQFMSGEQFALPNHIFLENRMRVKPGDTATFRLQGHSPRTRGIYSGVWELRLPNGQSMNVIPVQIQLLIYE